MSFYTDVLLSLNYEENQDEIVSAINNAVNINLQETNILVSSGVYMASCNHLDVERLVDFVKQIEWNDPSTVQLFIRDETCECWQEKFQEIYKARRKRESKINGELFREVFGDKNTKGAK